MTPDDTLENTTLSIVGAALLERPAYTAGQRDSPIGRTTVAVPASDGREFATDGVLTAVRQSYARGDRSSELFEKRGRRLEADGS